MRIAIATLGCRTNQAESARLEQSISDLGHQIVEISDDADICIINTCSVTAKADYQSRQLISRASKGRAEIIVTGCYAELNSQLLFEKNSHLSIIRNRDKSSIINLIPPITSSSALTSFSRKSRNRPTVKVQDGCNNACSYCIIPSARGASRSVPSSDIVAEIKKFEDLGYEEIVLSGIHLGIYGKDLSVESSLANLLEEILKSTSRLRIRLSSLEINEISDHLLSVIKDERICKHLHIPLQSADDTILSKMNRTYSLEEYDLILSKCLSIFSNLALGTDIIVGFPTEDASHFKNTISYLDSKPFTYIHAFPFSSRPSTKAASLRPAVREEIKRERVLAIRQLSSAKKESFLKRNIGIDHEILVETVDDNNFFGTTSNYIKVLVPKFYGPTSGKLVGIRITGICGDYATGLPLNAMQPTNK